MHNPQTDALFAYACATLRPAWDGAPITGLQEALGLASSPVSLILIATSALALWIRQLWLTGLLCLGWAIWAGHILFEQIRYEPYLTAQQFGCIGRVDLFITFATLICAALLAATLLYRRPA